VLALSTPAPVCQCVTFTAHPSRRIIDPHSLWRSPFRLPVLLPGTVALLASDSASLSLAVVAGKPLTLSWLAVDGRKAPSLPKRLEVGESLHWT
jgi:hypothetical protein